MLEDDGFKFPSTSATEALSIAGQLFPWCNDVANTDALTAFVSGLFDMFDRCLFCSKRKLTHSHHIERIWGAFHKERCSPSHVSSWSAFLEASVPHTNSNPIFYQFVTDYMFKVALKQHFRIEEVAPPAQPPKSSLSFEEKNCVRYVAGALFRAVQKKVKRSALPMKEEMLLCMIELLEGQGAMYDESSDWVNLMDRGGLNHVSNTTFLMLSAMEVEVKAYVADHPNNFNMKDVLKQKLLANDEVDFHWEALSVNWGEKESKELLSVITDHYLTVRGFAFASNWMEKYKDSTKKKVQKSKGIRKTLLGSASDSVPSTSEDHD